MFRNEGNILDADQHADCETGLFFMRLCWDLRGFRLDASRSPPRSPRWRGGSTSAGRSPSPTSARGSRSSPADAHCLYDLLLTDQLGELGGELALVISNHAELASVAEHFGVRFVHVPVDPADKAAAEAAQQRLLEEERIDLVVLARYMQILSPAFVARWPGRIINIHHSFLPAFVGSKPYHQAKERGVKSSARRRTT